MEKTMTIWINHDIEKMKLSPIETTLEVKKTMSHCQFYQNIF